MNLSRYQFEILKYIEKNGSLKNGVQDFSNFIKISVSEIDKCIKILSENGLVSINASEIAITEAGIGALKPYKVRCAVIMAAGFGERMLPATKNRPKPMVTVNGVRIIDTLIDALVAADIKDIYVIRGYKKEVFSELKEKYPFVTLVDNDEYDKANNIASIMKVLDKLDNCYICEADLFISNPAVIEKYHYVSNILGSYSMETDDWCFRMNNGCVCDFQKGNTFCYNEYGISFWTQKDCESLKQDYATVYNEYEDGKQYFWDYIPLILFKDKYNVEIRQCQKSDIIEIDSFHELQLIDPSYYDFKAE